MVIYCYDKGEGEAHSGGVSMRKSCKRLYELDRKYDYSEFCTSAGVKLAKRRAHRRVRQLLKDDMRRGLNGDCSQEIG